MNGGGIKRGERLQRRVLLAGTALAFWAGDVVFSQDLKTVMIIRSSSLPLYSAASKACARGLTEKRADASIQDVVLPENTGDSPAFFQALSARHPSAILAVGAAAARQCREGLPQVPMIFCLVLDPASLNLGGATGVALEVPLAERIGFIQKHFPWMSRVGVIYRLPAEGDALREAAKGLRVSIVPAMVPSVKELSATFARLSKDVDCILMPMDAKLCSPEVAPQLLLESLQLGTPTFWGGAPFLKAGALAAVYGDIDASGYAAGHLTARVLGGESPAAIPAMPPPVKFGVNLRVAKRLGINVTEATISSADEVIR
jgi:putative tryptophan/tyrosine transport system substrate-binding protein